MKAIIPAIDISGGRCVRLSQGNFATKKTYNHDPVELASEFFAMGAKRLHIVDLDAAFRKGNNRALIKKICKIAPSDGIVEVGGGIRDKLDIKTLLNMGAHRLCLGTVLVTDIFSVIHWTKTFGSIFVGSFDVKDGQIQVAGWQQEGGINAENFLKHIENIDLCSLEYTNITKDGTLSGPDFENAKHIADVAHAPVIISGGVSSLEDIDEFMNTAHENILGIIVGKAFFENQINLVEAFKKYPSPNCITW